MPTTNEKMGVEMKELIDSYLKDTVEFSSMLEERTAGEVAYDHEVVIALRRRLSIKRVLEVAGEKYQMKLSSGMTRRLMVSKPTMSIL
jgi:hypothetical protein